MVRPPRPTQLRYLEAQGITPPPTSEHCRRLMSFLKSDVTCPGKPSADRIRRLKELQSNWIGKAVMVGGTSALRGTRGTVSYVSLDQVRVRAPKRRKTPGQLALRFRTPRAPSPPSFIAGIAGEHESRYELALNDLIKLS